MKRIVISCFAMLLGAVAGCGSSDKCASVSCGAAESCDSASGACVNNCASLVCTGGLSCDASVGMCVSPPAPSLATAVLIDRMGRPAVNTALTNPFDLYKPTGASTAEMADTTKDRYNLDGNPANWSPNWAAAIGLHLGIFDALNDTCGTQVAYTAFGMSDYSILTAVLAGDALQIDTAKTTCAQYLAAELTAVGQAVSDCGGRKLNYDVIDVTYSALAAGTVNGVDDGITESTQALSVFPFLTAPK